MRSRWSCFWQHENGDLIMITDRGEFVIVPSDGPLSLPFRTPEAAMDAHAKKMGDLARAEQEAPS